jgi:dipeptidyl aminopeptidase/acylaminoacyl peptidase
VTWRLSFDTHKFESRYLDRLVCPYTERKELYHERSAVNYVDRLAVPLILFQGLEDKIVPPNQAETMYAAVRDKGLPVAYLPFEGEQHCVRRAENINTPLRQSFIFIRRSLVSSWPIRLSQ